LKPISIVSEIDLRKRFPGYDQLNDDISAYGLSLFRPSEHVYPEFRGLYNRQLVLNFTQEQREYFLIGMMKVNFLKRLESSVRSFATTMKRTVDKIKNLEDRITQLYHLGFRSKVARSTLADANESRDWRIFADFAHRLINTARRLYASEPMGVDLNQSLYALDSTTIDLCLSLFRAC
jgi:hypothetical protein